MKVKEVTLNAGGFKKNNKTLKRLTSKPRSRWRLNSHAGRQWCRSIPSEDRQTITIDLEFHIQSNFQEPRWNTVSEQQDSFTKETFKEGTSRGGRGKAGSRPGTGWPRGEWVGGPAPLNRSPWGQVAATVGLEAQRPPRIKAWNDFTCTLRGELLTSVPRAVPFRRRRGLCNFPWAFLS